MTLTMAKYRERIIDDRINNLLPAFGAVCLEGPKWCGKTWTSLHHANSVFYLADPANNFQNRRMAEMSPELVLQGNHPRLLNEWQEVPALWDAIRFEVDRSNEKGSYLLTGSATPNEKRILHNGTGRIITIRMRPMSLFESGESNGSVSLESMFSALLAGNESTILSNRTLQKDMMEEHDEPINDETVAKYLDILKRLFIIEDIPAYSTNLRSSVRLGKTPKRQFCDPSLAAAAFGATPDRLLNDLNTFGFLFESLCLRDLRN